PISHRWPMIFVEPRRALEPLLADVEQETVFDGIQRQCRPGNGKQLASYAEEPAERKYRISNPAGCDIEHDRFDLADVLASGIYDFVAVKRGRVHQEWT